MLFLLNLWREKHTSELRILAAALFIAVFTITALMSLSQAIGQSLTGAASEFLGADLIVESSDPLPQEYKKKALELDLDTSFLVEFFSMLVANNQYQLGVITAMEETFPLKGQLEVLGADGIQHFGPPPPGQLWMQEDLSKRLNIKLNEIVNIGDAQFIFSGILQQMPLAMSSNSNFAPLVYVNAKDLDKMAVIQPGSRVMYRLLLKGETKQINAFRAHFKSSTLTWVSPSEGRFGVKQTLRFANRYSAVILLIQIILAGIAIMMCSYQYSVRQQKKVALLRTMGASSGMVIKIEVLSLLLFASLILMLAIFVGFSVAKLLLQYHKYLALPKGNLSWQGCVYGGLTGMVLLIGFMLGPLLRLRHTTALSILQRTIKPYPQWSILTLSFSLGLLWLLFALWVGEGDVALRMGLQIGVLSLLILVLSYGLWRIFDVLSRYGPLSWRFGIAYMVRHKWNSIIQWLVFTIVFSMLILIQIIQQNINTFTARLPAHTPNYFLLNIQPTQVEDLKKWLAAKNVSNVNFYPIVRGRMPGLQRPINLTWMRTLPQDNQVVEGMNWDLVNAGSALISVEKNFSERHKLKINDTISFQIAGELITGKIVQLRSVEWESFKPNFYVVFPPKTLDKFPQAYITSFYLPESKKNIITDLIKNYVEISVIDIDVILQKIRTMISKIALVLQTLLVSVLVMGILIMYISLQSSLKERLKESAMLQILGANKRFVIKVLMIEFAVMGSLSGLAGVLMAWVIAYGLNKHYFELAFELEISWLAFGVIGATFIIVLFGLIGSRSIFRISPLWLFKQNG